MKYVKPTLHTLDLSDWSYPRLHVHVGLDDYGNLDREEQVSVYFDRPFAGRITNHYVFQEQTFRVDVNEIREAIKEFNSDLKENWDKVIYDLLAKEESNTLDIIASRKESLKVLRKTMKKFSKEKDK